MVLRCICENRNDCVIYRLWCAGAGRASWERGWPGPGLPRCPLVPIASPHWEGAGGLGGRWTQPEPSLNSGSGAWGVCVCLCYPVCEASGKRETVNYPGNISKIQNEREKKKKFPNFHGASTMVDFKLPTWSHWMQRWKEMCSSTLLYSMSKI